MKKENVIVFLSNVLFYFIEGSAKSCIWGRATRATIYIRRHTAGKKLDRKTTKAS